MLKKELKKKSLFKLLEYIILKHPKIQIFPSSSNHNLQTQLYMVKISFTLIFFYPNFK